jgi:tetratricopeptide (TPR) repeat protein
MTIGLNELHQNEAAEAAYRAAIHIFETVPDFTLDTRVKKAFATCESALAVLQALSRNQPALEMELAQGYYTCGTITSLQQNNGEAEAAFKKAIELRRRGDLSRPLIRLGLARALNGLGDVHRVMGQLPQAITEFEEANSLIPAFWTVIRISLRSGSKT